MLLTDFENNYRQIFNSIDNPFLKEEDIKRIIDSDCSLTYSPTFFCIVNRLNFSVDYVSKNMHPCLGATDKEIKTKGLHFIWERIHKKDLQCLANSIGELLNFINNSIKKKQFDQLSYSWNYRFKKRDNTYINIIQHTTPFCLGSSKIKKGLTHFTVLLSKHLMPVRASLHLLNKNHDLTTKFTTNCSQRDFFKNISNREKDIIKLLATEQSSKSIGEKLFISSNTVDTHRRNIIKKLKLSSTGELINILKSQHNLF